MDTKTERLPRVPPKVIWKDPKPNGRTTYLVECPFCKEQTEAYAWSLAGSGKKCPCGALLQTFDCRPPKDTKQ